MKKLIHHKDMLTIRELRESDRALMETFWTGLSENTFKMWDHYNTVPDIFSEKSHKLIGLKGGKIVVYGFLLPNYDFQDTPSLGITTLDSEQRKGFGTAMMKRLEEVAKSKGYKNIFLTTFTDNTPAYSLYKEMGYAVQGIVKRSGKDSYAMKKRLR